MSQGQSTDKRNSGTDGITARTIRRLVSKFKAGGSKGLPEHKKPTGPHHKLSDRSATLLKRAAEANPALTARKLRESNTEAFGKVTVRTVRNTLNKRLGFQNVPAAKKPKILKSHEGQREQFYKDHIEWGLKEWKQVLFTDESTFFESAGHPK
ncbi:uncharacterized protein [Macrobrachium rosenbergii]|uniref:uncharacterized protein n=1 Tax=Macrobrachium rosenbergii TaxID=79674 RepID=UPI0034D7B973